MGRKIFAVFVTALFLYVSWRLIIPVTMGAVLAVLFLPWLQYLEKRKFSTGLGSALLTLVITLCLILPSSFMGFLGAKALIQGMQKLKQTPTGTNALTEFLQSPRIQTTLEHVTQWFPVETDRLLEFLQDIARSVGLKAAELLGDLFSYLPTMIMGLVVTVLSVYFFLVDGRRLADFVRKNSVFSDRQTDHLLKNLAKMCRSVILASLISGVVQAALETVFCLVTVTPNAFLIGALVFLGSFIPVIGSLPITLGVAAQQLLADRPGAAITLLIGAGVVSTIDNAVRPIFLRGSANIHPLLAFVAALGGLQMMGFMGVFLGPIIAGLFLITVQLLAQERVRS